MDNENLKRGRGRPKGVKNTKAIGSATLEFLRPIATKIILENMNSDDPENRKWAIDKFSKYIFRQLPQDVDLTSKGQQISGVNFTLVDSSK